jgi:hypothetical protein
VIKPTIYKVLRDKLGREPTNAELKAEVDRIKQEALVGLAEKGKLPFQRGRRQPTKKTPAQLQREYVAERPYHVYSSGASGDAFESRYASLTDAKATADRIVGRSAPRAYVRLGREIVYKTYAS